MSLNVIHLCPSCGGVCRPSIVEGGGVLVCRDCNRALPILYTKTVREDVLYAEEVSLP